MHSAMNSALAWNRIFPAKGMPKRLAPPSYRIPVVSQQGAFTPSATVRKRPIWTASLLLDAPLVKLL